MADRPTIVLVHGAWHGADSWGTVVERLRHRECSVLTVENPSSSDDPSTRGDLAADVAALQGTLDAVDGEKIVVAHSYGGVVATQATAGRDDVRHIVYVTAFMLDVGESLLGVLGGELPSWIEVVEDGAATVATHAEQVFYNDIGDETEVAALVARLRPQSMASFTDEVTAAGWHDIPTTYVVCTDDNAIAPDAQEQLAQRADTVETMSTSHSPMLSAPHELTTLITGIAVG